MKLNGGNYISGTAPYHTPHPPKPEAFNAVAGEPAEDYAGDKANPGPDGRPALLGQPEPREAVIMINGRNLVDIIAELQAATP